MRPLRHGFWRTLRFRLTMWNIVLVVVTSTLTVYALRQGLRIALIHEMDAVLAADLQEIVLAMDGASSGELPALQEDLQRKAQGHKRQGWFVDLLDRDGRVLWSSGPEHS